MKPPIPIVRPCQADWNQMTGDDRTRLCAQCNKHVHNLSALTPRALKKFVETREGSECIGYEFREDGSIVTAPRWPWLGRIRSGVIWVLAAVLPSLFAGCADSGRRGTNRLGGRVMVPGTPAPPPPAHENRTRP